MRVTSITPASYNHNNQRINTANKQEAFGKGRYFGYDMASNEVEKILQKLLNKIETKRIEFKLNSQINNKIDVFTGSPNNEFLSVFLTRSRKGSKKIVCMDIFGMGGHYEIKPEEVNAEDKLTLYRIAAYVQGFLVYPKKVKLGEIEKLSNKQIQQKPKENNEITLKKWFQELKKEFLQILK